MTRRLIKTPEHLKHHIFVKIFRKGQPNQIIEYYENLGSVSKQIYIANKEAFCSYQAKDHAEQVRKTKEFLDGINQKRKEKNASLEV